MSFLFSESVCSPASFCGYGQSGLNAVWYRIDEHGSVEPFFVVLLRFLDLLRVTEQFDCRAAHDLCSMGHALMRRWQLALCHHLPRMKRCTDCTGRAAHLHGRDDPTHAADIGRADEGVVTFIGRIDIFAKREAVLRLDTEATKRIGNILFGKRPLETACCFAVLLIKIRRSKPLAAAASAVPAAYCRSDRHRR